MTPLAKFSLMFVAAFGLLFGTLTFFVSYALELFSPAGVMLGLAIGLAIGAAHIAARLPTIVRKEIHDVHLTLHEEFLRAVIRQCDEQGIALDVKRLHAPVLQAARAKLRGTTFRTIDLDQELGPHSVNSNGGIRA